MIDLRIKQMFFDRPKVRRAVDRGKLQALSRVGAFIRQRARTSIRRRKKSSRPGEPPSSPTGLLRRTIFFGYDRASDSVVVGPVALHGRSGRDIPRVLEVGGRSVRGRGKKKRVVNVAARPYMRPAMEQEQPNIPKAFRNSVRSG